MIEIQRGPVCTEKWQSWTEILPLLESKAILWGRSADLQYGPYPYLYHYVNESLLVNIGEGNYISDLHHWQFQLPKSIIVIQSPGV